MLCALLSVLVLAAPPSIAEIDGLSAARITDLERFEPGLASADPATVVATIHALGRLQSPYALRRIARLQSHPDWRFRQAVAFAWGQVESASPKPLVARVRQDNSPAVRVTATKALGKLKDSGWGFLMTTATNDADHAVRYEARIAIALKARRNDGVGHGMTLALPIWLKDPAPRLRRAAAYAFRRATKLDGPTNFETALQCADDADPEVRALCVRVLGRFTGLEAHKQKALDTTLLKAATDADWRVGVEAWRSAKEAKRLAALAPTLMVIGQKYRALETPRLHVWTAGLDALLEARAPAAKPIAEHLFRLQSDGDSSPGIALGLAHVRCRAAAILDLSGADRLAKCDAAAPKGLIAALTGPVLDALEPPQRAQAIAKRYPNAKTPGMKIALLDAAGALKGQSAVTPTVLQGLEDADVAVFSQAATTAGKLGLQAAGDPILSRFDALIPTQEYEAAAAAIDALGALKAQSAKRLLRSLVDHSNVTIAEHASKALKSMGIDLPPRPKPGKPTPVQRPTPRSRCATS